MNTLKIRICESPRQAPNYNGGNFLGANLTEAVIVKCGTVSGKPTVDLVFEIKDKDGKVIGIAAGLVTGEIIKGLAGAVTGAER